MNKENNVLNIINWLTSVNFDELIFKTVGPVILIIAALLISAALALKSKRDLEDRTSSKFLIYTVPFLVFLTNIPGYIVYLILRPAKKESYVEEMERKYLELEVKGIGNCNLCDTTYFSEDMFCRKCGNQLRRKCLRCNNAIELTNFFCHFCGLQQLDRPQVKDKKKKFFNLGGFPKLNLSGVKKMIPQKADMPPKPAIEEKVEQVVSKAEEKTAPKKEEKVKEVKQKEEKKTDIKDKVKEASIVENKEEQKPVVQMAPPPLLNTLSADSLPS